MEGTTGAVAVVAPFVGKTYEMVSDPRSDGVIRWGSGHNSFLVLDPALFSHFLLPSYFKHCNFSSFVRQLNTYGFRKVDPDRWEFAHESFLRGQSHLLPLVVRRRRRHGGGAAAEEGEEVAETEKEDCDAGGNRMLLEEVGRLRKEQREMEEEIECMSRRLKETERRPQKMMSFLSKVAEDPEFLPRLIVSKKEQQRRMAGAGVDRRKRLLLSPPAPAPALPPPTNVTSFALDALFSVERIEEKPCASTSSSEGYDDGAAVVPAMPPAVVVGDDCSGRKTMVQPEMGIAQASSAAAAVAATTFPFSMLGEWYF